MIHHRGTLLLPLTQLVTSHSTLAYLAPSKPKRRFLHPNPAFPTASHRSNPPYASPPQRDQESSLDFEDALYLERFKRRVHESSQLHDVTPHLLPFTNSTAPQYVISTLLSSLLRPHSPTPYFGYQLLYRTSTEKWRRVLRGSAGAASDAAREEWICKALSDAMEREDTQFGILVGMGVDDGSDDPPREYGVEFPCETLEYGDGTAWLECRLRNSKTDVLLVVLGWSLCRGDDGVWRVDGMEWQDFREKYRPGIGREMWERICG